MDAMRLPLCLSGTHDYSVELDVVLSQGPMRATVVMLLAVF
jgi:hypothetical protein